MISVKSFRRDASDFRGLKLVDWVRLHWATGIRIQIVELHPVEFHRNRPKTICVLPNNIERFDLEL